jgi:hypothetical protein
MIKRYNSEKHLEKFLKSDVLGELEDVIIFQNTDGSYELFNSYIISKNKQNEYIVTMHTTYTERCFFNLKHAVAWCTFDKRNMLYKANRILELDGLLAGLEVDISLHTKIFKNSKESSNKLIFLAKLNEDKMKKKQFTDELYTYINDSKKWQTKRFNRKPEH